MGGRYIGRTSAADKDFGANKIQRANLDGTNVEDFVTAEIGVPGDITVDADGSGIPPMIQRANLDGANVEDLVNIVTERGFSNPTGIAVDWVRGKVYWTARGTRKIQRANLDGANVEDFIVGLDNPQFIALDLLTPPSNGIVSVEAKRKWTALWGRVRQNALLQNYPNPFNPETWIPYLLAEPAHVTIQIYGISRQLVRTLNIGQQDAGEYVDKAKAAYWDGRNDVGERMASGVYFYRIQADNFIDTRKMELSQ